MDGRRSIRGWPCGHAQEKEECLAFAKAHGIKCLVETFPLDKAQEAYDRLSPAFQRFLEGLTAVHNADFFNEVYARSIFYVL